MFLLNDQMMLILYKNEGIRIVIGTANMIQQDWHYKTNAHYVQDFPFKSDIEKQSPSEFESSLIDYCNHIKGMSNRTLMDFSFLNRYDFSSAKVLLIPSVPGYHRGDSMYKFGHQRLSKLLSSYNMRVDADELVVNISSFGSLKEKWLIDEFFRGTFHGDCSEDGKIEDRLKILWPTVDNVRNSVQGYASGGSLCLPQRNCKDFLRRFMYRWDGKLSGRAMLMPHIKSYSCINVTEGTLKFMV